jgi:hypothetical protein
MIGLANLPPAKILTQRESNNNELGQSLARFPHSAEITLKAFQARIAGFGFLY